MSDLGRLMKSLRAIVRELMADTKYHGLYEYVLLGKADASADLSPKRPETGLPALSGVPMRTGLGGAKAFVDGGSVLVAFVDGDPTRPAVIAYASPGEDIFSATLVTLASTSETDSSAVLLDNIGRVVRYGDRVSIPVAGSVALGPVEIDPSATQVSRVKA